jgi:hypothetical protein
MPGSRTSTSKRTTKGASAASGEAAAGKLVCPECGREFTRPAALGAHRKGTHGVAGTSTNATASRRARSRGRRGAASTGSTRPAGSSVARRGPGRPPNVTIDRDALLAALFPEGVPPRESVIRELAAWLDQAERLAKQR